MGYNKNVLRQQRNKYNEAISNIDSSIAKLENIIQKLNNKSKLSGSYNIDLAKSKARSAINDLKSTKTSLNNTIIQLNTEINRVEEDIEE